jgi:glycine cleavage system T protein (aminomethyltransferase)
LWEGNLCEMAEPEGELRRTPLYRLHRDSGAKFAAFAGYDMPVQYAGGILSEHQHTRRAAGLFDVSHMGQLALSGGGAAAALEALMPIDVIGLPAGLQRYGLLTNASGGILDDLMVTNLGDRLFLVVNGACKAADIAHLRANLSGGCALDVLADRALLALQGPAAARVLGRLAPQTTRQAFMTAAEVELEGVGCLVSRSGYTGEDGFEISLPAAACEAVARRLLAEDEVALIGLGARDSLRLEAGLCLYGADLDEGTTPVEAGLAWALSKARRADGARPGGYPGAEVILAQLAGGAPRRRVGLKPDGRAPVRGGTELVDDTGRKVGSATSGGYGPTVGAPVAMGYVEAALARDGAVLTALVRGKPQPVQVTRLPFVKHNYFRG